MCVNIWHNSPIWQKLEQLGKRRWRGRYKQELHSEPSSFSSQTECEPKHPENTLIYRYFQVSERAESAMPGHEGQFLSDFQSFQVTTSDTWGYQQSEITRCSNIIKCLDFPQSNVLKLVQNSFSLTMVNVSLVTEKNHSSILPLAEQDLSPTTLSTWINAERHLGFT